MATFTEQQIDECIINRCESFKTNGAHDYWVFQVTDVDGCSYEWRDTETAGNADDATLKAAARVTMLTYECKSAEPIKSIDSIDTLIGTTLA